ncbi:universal stress protein [Roseateles amylovorans]|uniref:Universal stress protein n=1 Tax=Roseateles amylovorans TaxID=2978473 RepID=A0ABY6AX23_9BURK|nr:universal stress protein [Roseateles amylovorans]UXH77145.1 universal stress protein [Roseateles amylovorans]
MYRSILVPIDGSETASRGLQEAIGLAKALGARITLLHVLDLYPFFGHSAGSGDLERLLASRRDAAHALLASSALDVRDGGVSVKTDLKESLDKHAGPHIVAQAIEHHCDLIVMGTHGRRGVTRLLLGSDASLVLRDSPVPVMLVGPPAGKGPEQAEAASRIGAGS